MALTRAASLTFDHILETIKNSNLNFHLQQSPFSAIISLKKSSIKDVGIHIMPTLPVAMSLEFKVPKSEPTILEQKLRELENDNETLKLKN